LKAKRDGVYLSNHTFDGVPTPIVNLLGLDSKSLECRFEVVRSIDEERGLRDLLFVAGFAEKQQSESRGATVAFASLYSPNRTQSCDWLCDQLQTLLWPETA